MITPQELSIIYTQYQPLLIKYLTNILKLDQNDAFDIYQNAILKFWKHYQRPKNPLCLLVQICKNIARDKFRLEKYRSEKIKKYIPDEQVEATQIDYTPRLKEIKGKKHTVTKLLVSGVNLSDISQLTGLKKRKIYKTLGLKIGNL